MDYLLFFLPCSAVGCPDIKAPPGGKVERHGNDAVITCSEKAQTRYITCKGSEWIGDVGNCGEGRQK